MFRYRPKLILCVNCADREGIRYRPSLRWERQKSDGRSPQTRKRCEDVHAIGSIDPLSPEVNSRAPGSARR